MISRPEPARYIIPDVQEGNSPIRRTSVDVDARLLDQARDVLGTSSIKETIDGALREVLRAEARRREIRALAVMDGLDLADEKVMVRAWRS